jgi:AcrR family transcriptional regulator
MPTADEAARARTESILEAAERVFAEKGYAAAGIADVAALLGIGHGTFYRYFRNKHEIALLVLERVVARMAAPGLAEDPCGATDLASYRAQTERILARMIELGEERPQSIRFFHEQSHSIDPGRVASVLDTFAAHTALFLRNGVERGFLRADLDIEPTAQALTALILEGTRRAVEPGRTPEERRRWARAGVALMYEGIGAAGGAPAVARGTEPL